MTFLLDAEQLKSGLVIFRRADVKHDRFYCRVKLPKADRYKVVSLKTSDRATAREAAFKYDMEVQTLIKHDVPIFNRLFSVVADDYLKTQKARADTGIITRERYQNIESAIRTLNIRLGQHQIHTVTQADWDEYPVWRRTQARRIAEKKSDKKTLKLKPSAPAKEEAQPPKQEKEWRVSNWTIRAEMTVLRSIMVYAASKKYVPESQIFKGKLQTAEERREEFTREEYRALHSKARSWVNDAHKPANKCTASTKWYREMVYNFVLVMCNTGMRPPEAKNLRWRDVTITTIRKETKGKENKNEELSLGQGDGSAGNIEDGAKAKKADAAEKAPDGKKPEEQRKIAILNVRGKGKYRRLVAPDNVVDFLERIRAIAKATGPEDYVFTTYKGKRNNALYASLIKDLLNEAKMTKGPLGTDRSTYSFRHTYATLRLSEGVDVYLLAEQMGTSVQIIQDHYGHINPVKNADRILMGMHEWEKPEGANEEAEAAAETTAENARVNKGAAVATAAKSEAAPKGRVNKAPAAKPSNAKGWQRKTRR